ncbi:MAG: ImmA/IrrE family metallo-endopeptidase [Lachnospiraceae bacterium]|nr:ImmA/IrrE family metallo-endopeptidase [Lachnospiraceae bacterium]
MRPELYLIGMSTIGVIVFVVSFLLNRKSLKEELAVAVKQDISIEQMRIAEKKVSNFLFQNGLNPGEGISVIGRALNIYEGDEDDRISSQAHLSGPDRNGAMVVTFRKGLSRQERTFAFAHECGHVINEDDAPIDRPDGKHKPQIEQAADYVAAALLMPLDEVYVFLCENRYQDTTPQNRIRLTKTLCRKYGVSEVIALRRIREVFVLKSA